MYYPRKANLYVRTRHAILVRAHDGELVRLNNRAGLRCTRLG